MLSLFGLIISLVQSNLIFPKQGSLYGKTINLPLIGCQTIKTRIISDKMAYINLEGIINENGTAKYIKNNRKEIVLLSWNLRKLMRKFRSEFSFPYYDIENDEIIFKLKVRTIFLDKKIILKKITE